MKAHNRFHRYDIHQLSDFKKLLSPYFYQSLQRKTFLLHFVYSIIEGIILGVMALNEYVLIKGLKGSDYQIGMLFQLTAVLLLFSVFINEIQKRIADKRKMFIKLAFITRLPLILMFFLPHSAISTQNPFVFQWIFLFVFLMYFLADPFILPNINKMLKNNYRNENFSKFYGYSATANKITMLIVTFLFGILLDFFPFAYVYVYPVLAVLGITSISILAKIGSNIPYVEVVKKKLFTSVKDSFFKMIVILRTNKSFLDFEIGFMLYGVAWMITVAVVTVFMEKVLHVNYSSIAFYKNFYNSISIFLLPFLGKILGKTDPRKFAAYTYAFLVVFMAFMMLTQYFPKNFEIFNIKIYLSLVISYISYGIFGAMMALLWYIGSAYFCKIDDVAEYQSIHLWLTGFRAFFGPVLGIFLYKTIGFSGVFVIAIILLFLAIFLMIWSNKNRLLTEQK